MVKNHERLFLQGVVTIFAFIPIAAGIFGILFGPAMIPEVVFSNDFDSHFRYLSGLLLGIGFAFWSTIPHIEKKGSRFRILTIIVFIGGLGRLLSLLNIGIPSRVMICALVMEIVITPLLCLWQWRIADINHAAGGR